MKTQNYKGNEERLILTALIVHDGVLGKVTTRAGKERDLFRNRWANLIAGWCMAHFRKFGQAPKKTIEELFREYVESSKDQDAVHLVESFLSSLSAEYGVLCEEINEPYILDLASSYFDRIRLERMAESIQVALERSDTGEARKAYSAYIPMTFAAEDWRIPFDSADGKETFRYYEREESLVQYPGDLGIFLSPHFERDGFIAFVGPEKRGKSFWLLDVVVRAVRQRRKILYYVVGDMGLEQVRRRLYVRITHRPLKATCCMIPKEIILDANGEAVVKTEKKDYEPLTYKEFLRAREELIAVTGSRDLDHLRLKCIGGGLICAGDIENDVAGFVRDGWVPDLVVIDYADELAPEPDTRRMDKRDQINENWRVLRRIALKYHCLMVTATQAAARSYDKRTINRKDFSEDKRKNAHVTGMIGLNQFAEEKVGGLYRLNWILLREGAWAESQMIWTAGNLALANPCMVSKLQR